MNMAMNCWKSKTIPVFFRMKALNTETERTLHLSSTFHEWHKFPQNFCECIFCLSIISSYITIKLELYYIMSMLKFETKTQLHKYEDNSLGPILDTPTPFSIACSFKFTSSPSPTLQKVIRTCKLCTLIVSNTELNSIKDVFFK